MKLFLQRLWLRRWVRGGAWSAISLLTLLVLARQYMAWSGARQWVAAQAMLAREGESLDLRAISPEPVPDALNFCAIEALKDLPLIPDKPDDASQQGLRRRRLVDAALPKGLSQGSRLRLPQGAGLGRPTDLAAWAEWLRKDGPQPAPPDAGPPASQVLAALAQHDALVQDLAAGLSRPESQWTPAWKTRALPEHLYTIAVPHYSPVQGLTKMLCLRATAAARDGDARRAHESLLIAARLNEANLREPFLIGMLVGCANSALISSAVWELCDAHTGTAEDFRQLQSTLTKIDYASSALYAGRGELAASVSAMLYLARTRDPRLLQVVDGASAPQGDTGSWAVHIVPRAWFEGNAASIIRWQLEYNLTPLKTGGLKAVIPRQTELESLLVSHKQQLPWQHFDEAIALIVMPALSTVTSRAIYTQSVVNQSISACALERYRLEHQEYPETLAAASHPGEKELPLDVLSGKPMGYRRTPEGKYALWCTGFDGRDDGGTRRLDQQNPEKTKFSDPKYLGDWVWDFPAP